MAGSVYWFSAYRAALRTGGSVCSLRASRGGRRSSSAALLSTNASSMASLMDALLLESSRAAMVLMASGDPVLTRASAAWRRAVALAADAIWSASSAGMVAAGAVVGASAARASAIGMAMNQQGKAMAHAATWAMH